MSTTSFPSWTLSQFQANNGKPKYIPEKEFVNQKTGEVFKRPSLGFEHPTEKVTNKYGKQVPKVTFVAFSSKRAAPSPRELMANILDYQIIQIESGSYICCRRGEESWIDLDFTI